MTEDMAPGPSQGTAPTSAGPPAWAASYSKLPCQWPAGQQVRAPLARENLPWLAFSPASVASPPTPSP